MINCVCVCVGCDAGTASMVATICHAWLMGHRQRESEDGSDRTLVVPVINVKRASMWKLKQAAWLFHHAGLDATALLFTDEVNFFFLCLTR